MFAGCVAFDPHTCETDWGRDCVYGSIDEALDRWSAQTRVLAASDFELAASLEKERTAAGFPVRFYPGRRRIPATLARLETHGPCGAEVITFVQQMKPPGPRGSLVLDPVLETDAEGHVSRRWHVPVNHPPDAIQGDELFVSALAEPIPASWPAPERAPRLIWLAIATNETFRIVPRRDVDEPEPESCREASEFVGSAYVRCWRYRDLADGSVRHLMFNGPCT